MTNEEKTQTFEQFLESYTQSATRHTYHAGINSFLKSVYQTDEKTETLASRYIKEVLAGKRDCTRDVGDFITYTQTGRAHKPMPPSSVKLYTVATYGFLAQCCGIDIPTRVRRMLRQKMPKGGRARTIEDDLTREKLRKILHHCDIRLKALFLLLVSSGIRVGEAIQLKLDDVTLEAAPPVVHVRGEYAKEGDPYTSFISSEAKEALQEWLKVREDFIKDTAYRAHNIERRKFRPWQKQVTPPAENSLFPFTYNSAQKAFIHVLQEADLYTQDKTTGIATIHIHMLRKYFLSQIKTKIPSEVAEALVGHAGYLSDAYRRYNTQQLAEFYRKGESALFILQDTAQLEVLNGEVDKKDRQLAELVTYNQTLLAKNESLQDTISKWDAYFMEKFGKPTAQTADEMAHNLVVERLAQRTAEAQAEEDLSELLKVGTTKSPRQRA